MSTNDKLADALRIAMEWNWLDDDARPSRVAEICDDALAEHAASLAAPPAQGEWAQGAPSKPWSEEWFIAVTTSGDRVVLRALPESYTYDFTTADGTHIKRDRIAKWMQFPDSEFIAPQPAPAPVQPINLDKFLGSPAYPDARTDLFNALRAQPPAPGEAELPPLPARFMEFLPAVIAKEMRDYARVALAALAQQRVPDAVREQVSDSALAQAFREATANSVGAHDAMVYARARDIESALASAEGNAVDLVQFRYAVEGWRDCARALAKVCDRPADCAYAEAESVRLLDLIDQQQEARK